jgi:radical SAM domain protein
VYIKVINGLKRRLKYFLHKIKDIEIAIMQVVFKKNAIPVSIYIEPTNICNANCIFCAYQFYKAPKKVMDLDMLEIILREAKKLQIKRLDLTPFAGDILTDKNILDKIELIKKYNFESVCTYTNLLNLHKIDVDRLLLSGLTEIYISASPLDKDLHKKIFRNNKYNYFLDNLVLILDKFNKNQHKTVKKINIEFRSNISLKQCLELPDYLNKIKSLINKSITVGSMQVFDSWMGAIDQNDLLEGMYIAKQNGIKRIPCSRLNNIQILSNGDIRVCGCRFNNQAKEDIFLLGNIKDMSIYKAYNSEKVRNIKKKFIIGNPPIECQKCSWYS